MSPARAFLREGRATLVLAAPLALAQLAQMAMAFVDVMMIGRLGPAAMAGAVVGSSLFFSLSILCTGTVSAVNPSVAQAVGAGDREGVSRAVRQGLWLATMLGVPLFVLFGNIEPLLRMAGQSPETSALAAGYLGAIRWGVFPNLWFTALRGLCEGISRPRAVLVITGTAAAVNAAVNYVLIYGKLGFPAMGLRGAAWASALAMTVMAGAGALYVARSRATRPYAVFSGLFRPDPAALKALFRLGWPIGGAFGLEAGLFASATLLIGRFGEAALAAHQVALNAASVTFMVPLGIGLAASVRVGQATGRGDRAGAARAGWAAIGLAVAFMACTACLFWLRPEWVVWIYTGRGGASGEVVRLAAVLLGVAAAFQLFDGTQVSAAGVLRGLKDTRAPMVISGFAYWGAGMGLALALGFGAGWGALGVWWGLTAGLAAAAVLLVARFRYRVAPGHAAWRVGGGGPDAAGPDAVGPAENAPAAGGVGPDGPGSG